MSTLVLHPEAIPRQRCLSREPSSSPASVLAEEEGFRHLGSRQSSFSECGVLIDRRECAAVVAAEGLTSHPLDCDDENENGEVSCGTEAEVVEYDSDDDSYSGEEIASPPAASDAEPDGTFLSDSEHFSDIGEASETEVVYVKEGVCVWPSRRERIAGRLSLIRQHRVTFMAWLPYSVGCLDVEGGVACGGAQGGEGQGSKGG